MLTNALSGFVLDRYRSLLVRLRDNGYSSVRLQDLRPEEPCMYLRHDVDLSLEHAATMAQVEGEMGVTSTYFVLLSTDIYNPASAKSRALMTQIMDCGHEIGLHFDATQYPACDLDVAAERECDILSTLTGRPVDTISFHRPAPELLNLSRRFAGRRHTYEPAFFSEIAYISDSNGGWHYGHPLDHPAIAAGTAVQLLTHPIWWVGDGEREAVPLIRNFVSARMRHIDDAVAGTVTAYGKWRAALMEGNPA
ncbi:hypothetical protein LZK98_15360 [Sphingomonas cannabina]|uniref:hypothetical protein n=1 Tax=Sphingomonas cannabina TaxID=2899123 RepID=UPI001F361821|nr:hypothetical protein [Sphingomonas cannabina]UIJ44431.1 hypothetical protein LZK98_15360 [Sphingomonas cannabina]